MSQTAPQSATPTAARGRLEVTPRGRVTLLLVHLTGSAAWLTHDAVAQLATAALAAPFLVDWLGKLIARPKLSVHVAPRRTRAGNCFVERVEICNLRRTAHAHGLTLSEPMSTMRQDACYIETLPAATRSVVELPTRLRQRGVRSNRRFRVGTSYPFGMVRWTATPRCATHLVAEPARGELPQDVAERLLSEQHEPTAVGARPGGEYFALRDYVDGEDARHVHARRSAAIGAPVVRDLRGGNESEVALIVDLRRTPGRSLPFGDQQTERRISLAARVFDELRAQGITPQCVLLDAKTQRWTVTNENTARSFLDALAETQRAPFRPVEVAALGLDPDMPVFWVAAGGHDAVRERGALGSRVTVLQEVAKR